MNTKATGYALGAVAAATYGMNPLFALPLYDAGMSPESVLFFRYLFALPVLGIMLRIRGRGFGTPLRTLPPLALLGMLFALSSLALFRSYNYMDAGIASTLLFVYPIMVALIMAAFFSERITAQTLLCLVLALAGIGLLYKGADGATLSPTGTLLVMGSALAYAVYIVGVNRPRLKDTATLQVTFYVLLFGWSLFAVRALAGPGLDTPPGEAPWLWGNLLALGVLPTAVSLLCTTGAIQRIGSTPTAILGALEPATAIFFGMAVFGERLTAREGLGIGLIIAAVSFVVAGGAVSARLLRLRKLFPRLPRLPRR